MLSVKLLQVGSFKANSFLFLMLMSSQCLHNDRTDMIKANITYTYSMYTENINDHIKKTAECICITLKLKKKKKSEKYWHGIMC